MKVKIYLRAIVQNGKNCLALFDSNRNGDINDLITEVPAGGTVIWKLDCCSGIKSITRIYSKKGIRNVFTDDPKKQLFCGGFELHISKGIFKVPIPEDKKYEEEAYTIECVLCDKSNLIIDPVIRVPPPPIRGTN